ncbi:hypothetical protein P9250_19700 [Caballeronia sp. LP006]|uniref:hypothetical protein n=1 Tax=Caballeronia sp. LP006 TaxID=3038552 RepID=UPI00285AF2C5|nr:hypothetical protein [Caballeronia sp. LP006]MDR5830101.1 hypothetical protein [Caballeronia sp. LP006]
MNPPRVRTPISDAMNPPPSDTPISRAMKMFEIQATDPNQSMANGMIAAGSALMGGRDLKDGLAAAGPAFSNTFDATLNQQRDLNTPKVTPIADGAFTMVQLPGQQAQVIPNGQVAGFLQGQKVLAGQLAMQKEIATVNLQAQRDQAKDDRKNADEYQAKLTQTDTALAANQRALDAARGQAQNSPNMSRIAGAVPGIAQTLGWDDAAPNLVIQRAHIDAALVQDALKKGAITDEQAGFLNSDIPSASADREKVTIPWLEQQQEILQKVRNFQASQVGKANPTAPQGFATGGTSNTGSMPRGQSTGSGSYQPVAVSDKASYDALPSGTVFKAPDGSIRRKS